MVMAVELQSTQEASLPIQHQQDSLTSEKKGWMEGVKSCELGGRWVDDQMKIQISLTMCPPSCWFGGPLYKHPLLNYSPPDCVYRSRKVKPEATSSNNYDH